MDIVGTLYSTIPSNLEEGGEGQPMISSEPNEEYFFFSDGHSEISDTEVGHEVVVDESNLGIGHETMVEMHDNEEEEVMMGDIEDDTDGLAIDANLIVQTDSSYKPVLDDREREKLYKMAVIEDEEGASPRGGKMYNCDQCDESFGRKVMLEKHIEKYHADDSRPFTCNICQKKFKKRSKLQKHSWTHIGQLVDQQSSGKRKSRSPRKSRQKQSDGEEEEVDQVVQEKSKSKVGFVKKGKHSKFKCDMCKKGFSNPTKLLIHKRTTHKRGNQCEICMEMFSSKKDVEKHRKEVHPGEKPYKCSVCSKKFLYEHLKVKHETVHGGEAPFRCDPCDRGFLTKRHLSVHLDAHVESHCKLCGKVTFSSRAKKAHDKEHGAITKEMYNCRACGESFGRISDLTYHCKRNHKEMNLNARKKRTKSSLDSSRPSPCKMCGKVFERESLLRRHFSLVHKEPIFCRYCPKSFSSLKMVENHERIHTGEKPFECKHCGEMFRSVEMLRNHLKNMHSSSSKTKRSSTHLVCTVCSQKFEKSEHLTRHRRTHYDEKPYQCEQCGMRFLQLNLLKTHLMLHQNNKVFECQICTRKFTKAQARNEHTVVHTGIPLKCLVCAQEFPDQHLLMKHERRVHAGEKAFQCLVCQEMFDHRWSLFRHELTHNGEMPLLCNVGGLQIEDNIALLDYNTECFLARRREQMLALHNQ